MFRLVTVWKLKKADSYFGSTLESMGEVGVWVEVIDQMN
jgi:hypothetical protein